MHSGQLWQAKPQRKRIKNMRTNISSLLLLLMAALLAPALGCTGTVGQSWGGGSEGVSQTSSGKTMDYSIEHLTHNGRNYLVLAVEGCVKTSMNSGPESKGQLFTANNRQIHWSCSTADGKTGQLIMDGQTFDLKTGAVFVVSVGGDKTTTEQVPIDMSMLQGGNVTMKLQALENSAPRIAEFWKMVGKTK